MLSGKCEDSPDGPASESSVDRPVALAAGRDGTVYVGIAGQYLKAIRNGRLESMPPVFPLGYVWSLAALHAGGDGLLYVSDSIAQGLPIPLRFDLAYAVSTLGQQIPISTNYSLPITERIPPGIDEIVGFETKHEPFETKGLLGITTDTITGRVIVGKQDPPILLVYPKVSR